MLLHASRIHLRPNVSHFLGQFGIVLLELGGCFRKQDNHRVDTAANDRHEDTGNHQPDEESEDEYVDFQIWLVDVLGREEIARDLNNETNHTYDGSRNQRYQQQRVGDQIIRNDRFPTTILKERKDLLARLDVGKPVNAVNQTNCSV